MVAAIHDRTRFRTGVVEARRVAISRMVETFSGKELVANTPVVGRDVFTHGMYTSSGTCRMQRR